MESQAAQKLERQLAKVERKRWYIQVMAAVQIILGPPASTWMLWPSAGSERSVIAYVIAAIGLLWSLVGCLGLYAVTARRVQILVIFTSCEIFLAMITSCSTAVLLLLHHLNCWAPQPAPSAAASVSDAQRQPWLRCSNVTWLLASNAAMLLYLSATASEALSLRLRIQKTGKRNLNWNQKPQRWKERNVRRGASAALRSLAPHLAKDGDSRLDEDARLKYLATSNHKYVHKSLLLRFNTYEDGEGRRLLLNLRKGYFKHGDLFGTKIYLSQAQEVILDEIDESSLMQGGGGGGGAVQQEQHQAGSTVAGYNNNRPSATAAERNSGAERLSARRGSLSARLDPRGLRRRSDEHVEASMALQKQRQRAAPVRLLLSALSCLQRLTRLFTDFGNSDEQDEGEGTLYSVIVHARATSGTTQPKQASRTQ